MNIKCLKLLFILNAIQFVIGDNYSKNLAEVFEANYRFQNDLVSQRFKVKTDNIYSEENKAINWAFRAIAARRIVGGMGTSISTYPYTIAISRNFKHWCGGSVIDEQWVLTAGHCMEPVYGEGKYALHQFLVRAGSSFHNRGGYQARVNKVFFPPGYIPGSADYDYSLIRLDRPLPIGRNIAVLNLPSSDYVIQTDDMLVVTGWGSTDQSGQGNIPARLRFVPVPVITTSSCQNLYRFYITPRMICAGYPTGKRDACNHDSGGPAVKDGVLLGIVSFGGKKCGDPDSPGVYARVSHITNWVEKTITSNEAYNVPELRPKIDKAREQENKLKRFKANVEDRKNIIKEWLLKTFNTSIFFELAKRHLQGDPWDRRTLEENEADAIDEINLHNLIVERILGVCESDSDMILQVLALQETMTESKDLLDKFKSSTVGVGAANKPGVGEKTDEINDEYLKGILDFMITNK